MIHFFGGSNEPLLLDAHVPNVLVMIVYKEAKILPLWSPSTLCLHVCCSVCLSVLLSVCLSFCLHLLLPVCLSFIFVKWSKNDPWHLRSTVALLFWIELGLEECPILFHTLKHRLIGLWFPSFIPTYPLLVLNS